MRDQVFKVFRAYKNLKWNKISIKMKIKYSKKNSKLQDQKDKKSKTNLNYTLFL